MSSDCVFWIYYSVCTCFCIIFSYYSWSFYL